MRFELTLDEIAFIKETFGFSKLLCVEDQRANKRLAKMLKERGVIADKGTYLELSAEYRLLFKHWSQMRFSMFDPDQSTGKRLECLMANERAIILFRQDKKAVTLDYYDFNDEALDTLMAAMMGLDVAVMCENSFVLPMSMQEAEALLEGEGPDAMLVVQNRTGLSAELLEFCINSLAVTNPKMVLVEDHEQKVGYLSQSVNTERGIVTLKHVTPSNPNFEKMVLLFGDAKYTINSAYNF